MEMGGSGRGLMANMQGLNLSQENLGSVNVNRYDENTSSI